MANRGSGKSKKSKRTIRRRRPTAGKSSYTVNQLSTSKHSTIRTWITDVESNAPAIDALKTPEDVWGFEIFGYKSYRLYGSIESVAAQLRAYKIAEEHPKDAIKGIKVIKVEGVDGARQWQKQKHDQIEDTARLRKLKGKKYKQFKKSAAKKEKTSKEKIKKQAARIKKQAAKIRQQAAQLRKSKSSKRKSKRKK